MSRRAAAEKLFADRARKVGEFVRSLLAGIPWRERAECRERLTFPAPRSGRLRVENPNGRIRIVGEDRGEIAVSVCKVARAESQDAARQLARAIRVTSSESRSGRTVGVELPRRWIRTGQVHLEVRVPSKLDLEVEGANGRVRVEGLAGALRVRSTSGAVCVENVTGAVSIEASSARVQCARTEGALSARASNGKIQVEAHRGSLRAEACNGLVQARLAALGAEGVQIATSNGRIVLELPDRASADLDARVDDGVIRAQCDLAACARRTASRLVARLGRGGTPVKLCATHGSITIR